MKLLYLDTGELYLPIPAKSSTQIGGEAARAARHDPCHPMAKAKVKQAPGTLIIFMELFGNKYRWRTRKTLVFRRFDDMVFKPGATLGEEPVGQHFSRPFNGQISCKDPYIWRGPDRTMVFGQFGIE